MDTSHTRGSAKTDPDRRHDRGLSFSTFRKTLHDDDDELHAFGVDDVEVSIPAGVQKASFLDDR
jgi:hypothetical protein